MGTVLPPQDGCTEPDGWVDRTSLGARGPKQCAVLFQLHPRLASREGKVEKRFGRLVIGKCLEQYKGEGHQQGKGYQGGQLEFPIDFIDVLLSCKFTAFLEFMEIVCTPTEKQEESD
jgi:hypothetical protein